MKASWKSWFAVLSVVGLIDVAHAGVRHAGPVVKGNDEVVTCIVANTGRSFATVTIEPIHQNGSPIATEKHTISPGGTTWVTTTAPQAALCRFTSSGSTRTLPATLRLGENGGQSQTRAVLVAE